MPNQLNDKYSYDEDKEEEDDDVVLGGADADINPENPEEEEELS